MKIIQSFWSKPSTIFNHNSEKKNGGWPETKYHLMSWSLSCLNLRKFYSEVELITDKNGAELLGDILELPYTSIDTELDRLDEYSEKLWALGKLVAYQKQTTPFIHVDGDVYIWEKFNRVLENGDLIVQNIDTLNNKEYINGIKHLEKLNFYLPKIIREIKDYKISCSINAGLLGGNNIEFLNLYATQAIDIVEKNLNKMHLKYWDSAFAIIYEQLLFSLMANKNSIKIESFYEQNTLKLYDFMNMYGDKKYIHLMSTSKNSYLTCHEVEMNLLINYPNYHDKICRYLK